MQMCVWRRAGTKLFDFGSGGAQGAFDLWRKAISQNQIVSIHDKADVIELGISSADHHQIYAEKAHREMRAFALARFFKHPKSPLFPAFKYSLERYLYTSSRVYS